MAALLYAPSIVYLTLCAFFCEAMFAWAKE